MGYDIDGCVGDDCNSCSVLIWKFWEDNQGAESVAKDSEYQICQIVELIQLIC